MFTIRIQNKFNEVTSDRITYIGCWTDEMHAHNRRLFDNLKIGRILRNEKHKFNEHILSLLHIVCNSTDHISCTCSRETLHFSIFIYFLSMYDAMRLQSADILFSIHTKKKCAHTVSHCVHLHQYNHAAMEHRQCKHNS